MWVSVAWWHNLVSSVGWVLDKAQQHSNEWVQNHLFNAATRAYVDLRVIDFFQGEKAGELHNGHPVFLSILKDLKVKFEVNGSPKYPVRHRRGPDRPSS